MLLLLTYLDLCLDVVYCHCLYMHVGGHVLLIELARMYEDMPFYRGECVMHWKIQVFRFFR